MRAFASREAAWCAMLILDGIRAQGITMYRSFPDGSVKFQHQKAWFTARVENGAISINLMLKPNQRPSQINIHIPTSADQFEATGNKWNAHNVQHDAGDPHARARRNAFGDLCRKPTLEGYDGYSVPDWPEKRREALARVRNEKPGQAQGAARKLAQARLLFRGGR